MNGAFAGGAVWTLGGTPLPYSETFPLVDAPDAPEAEIPVERIAGPVPIPDAGHYVNAPPYAVLGDVRDGDDAWRRALDFLAEVGLGPES